MSIEEQFKLAIQHHTAGRLAEAAAIYRQILSQKPDHMGSRMNLAQAPRLSADTLQVRGDLSQSVQLYRESIQLNPSVAEVHNNLGSAMKQLGQSDLAAESFQAALQLNPQLAEAHRNLGELSLDAGQYDQAIAQCRAAITLRPDYHEAHNNLGLALRNLGRIDESIGAYQSAIQIHPSGAEYFSNLAEALVLNGDHEAAMAACRRALQLNPQLAETHCNMGALQKNCGRMDAAIASLRKAMELKPNDPTSLSSLIYLMHFHADCDMHAIAKDNAIWNQRFADPLRAEIRTHDNDRNPDRRLRIGYVSPDFRDHAECFFVLPLLEAHDHNQFEVHAYASVRRPDSVTERFRKGVDHWHDVLGWSNAALAEQIRKDRIDILIDLTMHMMDNRLPLFARKPAPVQVTWLAYPGSTGLNAIDYRLTDAYFEPADSDSSWSTEIPIRLPDCWCVYEPVGGAPDVNELPATKNGYITFGSLNNFCKFNLDVLTLWAKVLEAVSNSRLIILCPPGEHRASTLQKFQEHGIDPTRIEFLSPLPRQNYLRQYHRIDIALDPFPYNGITTTCDALWMGVPVLTLSGKVPASRAGLGLLNTVQLNQLCASSETDFIRLAKELSENVLQLTNLRSNLRDQIRASPLMDAPRFARNVESAYRDIWRRWCSSTTHPS